MSDTPRTDSAYGICIELDARLPLVELAKKLELELNAEKQLLLRACEDSVEDRERMAEFCAKAGVPQSVIDGDSWCVLGTTGLGELLFTEIQRLKTELNNANARITTLQVHLDRRWEMMRELETECGTKDVGEAVKFIKGLKERIKRLEHALSFVIPYCEHLDHSGGHSHSAFEKCPVEAIINKAKDNV